MTNKNTLPANYKDAVEKYSDAPGVHHYFAAANSADGFVSFFYEIFGSQDIKKLYILGGGPGSGKSTLLKRVAEESASRGYTTEVYHCSSSPFSLDGVIIAEKGVAVIDGTAPHTYSPSLAGVREIYVDMGAAWNTEKLYERGEVIRTLADEKKKQYRRAYIHLKAADLLDKEAFEYVKPFVLFEKMVKNATTCADKYIAKGKEKQEKIRIQRALSANGNIYLDSFEKIAKTVVHVSDYKAIAYLWFDELKKAAEKKNTQMIVSYAPEDTNKIDGLYLPESGVAFTMYAENPDKTVNCERFCDMNAIKNIRQRYGFAMKCKAPILEEAYSALKRAGELHELIEEEYSLCTDYKVTEKITGKLIKDIFSV